MALPIAPLIMAGSQLAGGLTNSLSQGSQNRRSQRFAREQYTRERDDNLAFWRMQNQYNDPSRQVGRLKKAGLNPALMYGGSASGAAGNAGSLSAPSSRTPNFQSSRPGDSIPGAAMSYMSGVYDLENKELVNNNLKAQNNVLLQDSALRAAQVQNTLQNTSKGKFDLGLASELRQVSAEAARENLRRMKQGNDIQLTQEERNAAMNSSNLKEAAQRILNMRAQTPQIRQATENLRKDGTLKQYDIELRKLGIDSRDPMWARILGRILNQYLGDYLPKPKINNFLKPGLKEYLQKQ